MTPRKNNVLLTPDSKKPRQTAVLYHDWVLSRFFWIGHALTFLCFQASLLSCDKCWPKISLNHMACPLYLRTMCRPFFFRGLVHGFWFKIHFLCLTTWLPSTFCFIMTSDIRLRLAESLGWKARQHEIFLKKWVRKSQKKIQFKFCTLHPSSIQ